MTLDKCKVLAIEGSTLYLARGHEILKSVDYGVTFDSVGLLSIPFFERMLASNSLLQRISRTGVHIVNEGFSDEILAVSKGQIHVCIDRKKGFSSVFKILRGSKPLNICIGKNGDAVWGEYFGNDDRKQIFIYRSKPPYDNWVKTYTFPAGSVRHIHTIVYDKWQDGYWILSGDYGKEAALWYTDCNFANLRMVLGDSQMYRAVALLPEEGRVIGATDTQLEQNYLYSLYKGPLGYKQQLNQPIEGPCFDLVKCFGIYIASTVIEKSNFNKSDFVHIYASENGIDWTEILKYKKDVFPKKMHVLTQFSRVSLVSSDSSPYLFLYGRGVKELNYKTRRIHYKSILKLISENQ